MSVHERHFNNNFADSILSVLFFIMIRWYYIGDNKHLFHPRHYALSASFMYAIYPKGSRDEDTIE